MTHEWEESLEIMAPGVNRAIRRAHINSSVSGRTNSRTWLITGSGAEKDLKGNTAAWKEAPRELPRTEGTRFHRNQSHTRNAYRSNRA